MKVGDVYKIDEPVLGYREVEIVGSRDTIFGKKVFYRKKNHWPGAVESMLLFNFMRRIIE